MTTFSPGLDSNTGPRPQVFRQNWERDLDAILAAGKQTKKFYHHFKCALVAERCEYTRGRVVAHTGSQGTSDGVDSRQMQ